MRLKMPANVQLIIDKLNASGYEAYIVGGCVRDSVLHRAPDDWDVTTSAQPCEVKKVFSRTVDTGIAHGTVMVLIGGSAVEVTTYRIDGEYEDNRHPSEVEFTTSLAKDLKRRDFTVNAMAYNDQTGLVDIFGGMEDLSRQVIRCVGKPHERFSEDALRILRAVRFAAQLDFVIDDDTKVAVKQLAGTLSNISAERIQVEVVKLLTSSRPEFWRILFELGITKVIMPEFDVMMATGQNNVHHAYNVGEHTIRVLEHIRNDKALRLAALLHDVGKPSMKTTDTAGQDHFKHHSEASVQIAKGILGRLKFDNETTNKVLRLIKWHDLRPQADEVQVRKAIYQVGDDIFMDFLELEYADTMGKCPKHRDDKIKLNENIKQIYTKIKADRQCTSLKEMAIGGKDLVELGIPAGPLIGEILNSLLWEVLEEPNKNTKEYLLKQVSNRYIS